MTETGMYLYPWDLGGSLDDFRRDYAATGCDAMAPALSYHRGNILSARSATQRRLAHSAVTFQPDSRLYGRLQPEVHRETADAGVAERLREWCSATGRRFSGWVVVLHNTTLGERHPDVVVENALGQRQPHALCPAHPEVGRYAEALVEDICAGLSPDSLMLESATPRAALHGEHHEIANVRVGPAALWLLSLCFCRNCLNHAAEHTETDPFRTRETCAGLIRRLLNTETHWPGNDLAQVATILLEYPEIHAYQVARQRRTAAFVAGLSRVMRRHAVEFRLIPSSHPFEAMCAFLEATGYRLAAEAVDAFVPLVYGPGESFGLVRNNIRLLADKTPVGMAMTLHPGRFAGKADFLGAVAAAAAEQPHCAFFYNYSIASAERLGWVAKAVSLLKGK